MPRAAVEGKLCYMSDGDAVVGRLGKSEMVEDVVGACDEFGENDEGKTKGKWMTGYVKEPDCDRKRSSAGKMLNGGHAEMVNVVGRRQRDLF